MSFPPTSQWTIPSNRGDVGLVASWVRCDAAWWLDVTVLSRAPADFRDETSQIVWRVDIPRLHVSLSDAAGLHDMLQSMFRSGTMKSWQAQSQAEGRGATTIRLGGRGETADMIVGRGLLVFCIDVAAPPKLSSSIQYPIDESCLLEPLEWLARAGSPDASITGN
jgi:hypothetical protein